MLKNWLYILKDKNSGQYIYLDSNNVVQYTATPTALVFTPDGWQRKSIAWERDLTKFGLVRSFTVSLNYVMDGKTLLDKISIQQTFDSPIQLIIQKLNFNTGSNAFEYIDFYIGEISLSQLESDEIKVSVPITEGGVSKQLKANESTVYEFDLDSDQDAVIVKHDGMNLFDKVNFAVSGVSVMNPLGSTGPHYLPAGMTTREGTAAGFAAFSNFGEQYDEPPNTDKAHFYTSQDIPYMRISGKIIFKVKFSGTPASPTQKYVVCLNSNKRQGSIFNTPGIAYLNPNGKTGEPVNNVDNTVTFDFDYTFTAQKDEYFFIYAYLGSLGTTPISEDYVDTEFKIEFKSRYKTTYIKALPAWILYKRLVGRITGDESKAVSTLLQANQNITLTSGDAVRGIVGSKIKTSLADFFKFCRVVFTGGMGIESETLVIEKLSHFCDVTTPISLGTCKDFKWKFAEELLFNTVKIGYDEKAASNTDNVNGKYAFNNSHIYTTPITSISKQLELICPYAADPFYIEIIRINLEGKTTTDNNADNEIMILNTEVDTTTSYSYTANFGKLFQIYTLKLIGKAEDLDKYSVGMKINVSDPTGVNTGTYTISQISTLGSDLLFTFFDDTFTVENGKAITISFGNQSVLKRETYVNTDTGVLDIDTVFNIVYLTPKRILKRWMQYINSCLFQFYGVDLTLETTEKNRELKTDNGIEVVDEDAPETIGMNRIFKALYYNFDTEVDDVVPNTLTTNPNKGFQTLNPLNNKTFTGILIKGAMAANEETPQSFRLLASPDDDENNLL